MKTIHTPLLLLVSCLSFAQNTPSPPFAIEDLEIVKVSDSQFTDSLSRTLRFESSHILTNLKSWKYDKGRNEENIKILEHFEIVKDTVRGKTHYFRKKNDNDTIYVDIKDLYKVQFTVLPEIKLLKVSEEKEKCHHGEKCLTHSPQK